MKLNELGMLMGRKAQLPGKLNHSVRDPEATKQQILDAAEIEFAGQGLNGARVDAIAVRAGVAPRMIYYYFQSKEGLYQAVLQRPATLLQSVFQQLNLDELPPDVALTSLIQAAIQYETANRNRGMLLFQEAIQNQGRYFKLIPWHDPISLLAKILERGVETGVFRPLDIQMTTLSIIGICTFYANAYENVKHLTPDQDLLSQTMIERYTQAAIQLALRGIQNSSLE
jgi:TetR/AcrR family transcriptional regulator